MKELKKVSVVQDESYHWYIIPKEKETKFYQMISETTDDDDYEEFEKEFEEYRTGGDLNTIQLYAEI